MKTVLTDIGRAIMILLDEYANAKETDYVVKPISYALYQTWRLFDATENERIGEDGEE